MTDRNPDFRCSRCRKYLFSQYPDQPFPKNWEKLLCDDCKSPKPDTDRPTPAPAESERPTAQTDRTIHTGSLMDELALLDAERPQECAASGAGHSDGPNGPKGETQCGYCGQSPPKLTAADYEEVLADHRRLVRELDVALNGSNAAPQASLCDLMGQLKELAGGYHEVLASKSVWVGGDYNGHYSRTLNRWLFPTKVKAEAFVAAGGINGYEEPAAITYRAWSK